MVRGEPFMEENIQSVNKINDRLDKLMAYLIPEKKDISEHMNDTKTN